MKPSEALERSLKDNGTDAKPVGCTLTRSQIIALEHQWRIKLKESGFSDIEMWDNRPRHRTKKLKFIKGHIRLQRHKTLSRFVEAGMCRSEYFRIVGLFAHHAPRDVLLVKYLPLLLVLSEEGYIPQHILVNHPGLTRDGFNTYMKRTLPKMIKFVREMSQDD